MTKSKAERKREDAIRQLKDKISFCQRRADFVGVIKYTKELNAMQQEDDDSLYKSLSECMGNITRDEKLEVTMRLISVVALGDILSGAIGDFKAYMRDKYNVCDINIIDDMDRAFKVLQHAVGSIDRVGKEFFSENYMNIVDELETQFGATLRNAALNKLLKSAKGPSKKGM